MIPRGGMFEYVSCPHYLAEIIIYLGLYIMSHLDTSMLLLLTWTAVNQTFAAILSHKWYHEQFKNAYPKHRRALVPYLF